MKKQFFRQIIRRRCAALFAAALLSFAICASASEDGGLHEQLLEGLDALYHGHLEQAQRLFAEAIHDSPDDPRGYFFLVLAYRWQTRFEPDSETAQADFEHAAKRAISVAQRILEKKSENIDALLYLAASYGYRAEYYNFLKHRWSKAYDDGVKMRKYLEEAKKLTQTTVDMQLGYGLYNYYAYLYREKIGWWRFLLSLPRGDKDHGLALLETVREKGMYANVEAWYFLIDIYKNEKDRALRRRALTLSEALYQTYPDNPFFHTLLAGIYHKNHEWQKAIRFATAILSQAEHNAAYSDYLVHQAKYLIGESSFFLGDYDKALRQFDAIIALQPKQPSYLLPWSHLRRGTIYSLRGQQERANTEYQIVLNLEDIHHAHELAEGLLKSQKQ